MFSSDNIILFAFTFFIVWRLCEMIPYFQNNPTQKKNFYPWLLPLPAILLAFFTPDPLSIFMILFGPFLYVLITWVNPKQISLTRKNIVIFILVMIVSLTFPFIFLIILFSYDLFFPYIAGLAAVFFLWFFICAFPWGRERFKKVTLASLFLLPICLGMIGLYQTNPTTYLRFVTIPYPDGSTKILWNTDILKHIKQNQQVVALEMMTVYDGIESLEFQDISENPRHENPFDGEMQFEGTVLVNHQYLVNFEFDMLANVDELSYPDISEPTEIDWEFQDIQEETNLVRSDRSLEWGSSDYVSFYQLDTPAYQKKLNSIDITYYEKNDVFKNAK